MKKLIKYYNSKTKLYWWIFENSNRVKWVVGCGPEVKFIPEDLFANSSWNNSYDEKDFSLENFKEALDENLAKYEFIQNTLKNKINKK